MINLSNTIACICEGGAETEIINLLVDNDRLKFNRDQLLGNEVIRCRNGKVFEERYLRTIHNKDITVLRILDSNREKFKLSKAYVNKIKVIDVVTSPEIEILLIISEGEYEEYLKVSSYIKPSIFCKQKFKKYKNVKSMEFVRSYYSNVELLVGSILEYKRLKKLDKGKLYLADLLK